MNVANLELCKELYELSGWKVPAIEPFSSRPDPYVHYDNGQFVCYRYDLGYLLRKLPKGTSVSNSKRAMAFCLLLGNHTSVKEEWAEYADTPEDALCQLAIELIKQNILQPSVTDRESD